VSERLRRHRVRSFLSLGGGCARWGQGKGGIAEIQVAADSSTGGGHGMSGGSSGEQIPCRWGKLHQGRGRPKKFRGGTWQGNGKVLSLRNVLFNWDSERQERQIITDHWGGGTNDLERIYLLCLE